MYLIIPDNYKNMPGRSILSPSEFEGVPVADEVDTAPWIRAGPFYRPHYRRYKKWAGMSDEAAMSPVGIIVATVIVLFALNKIFG